MDMDIGETRWNDWVKSLDSRIVHGVSAGVSFGVSTEVAVGVPKAVCGRGIWFINGWVSNCMARAKIQHGQQNMNNMNMYYYYYFGGGVWLKEV